MSVVLVVVVCGLLTGALAGAAAVRWPGADPGAPTVDPRDIAEEVARHRGLAAFARRRVDPAGLTGLLLTTGVVVLVGGLAAAGLLLVMVRTHSGFALADASAARFGAHHASSLSTSVLQAVTQLGGAVVLLPAVVLVALVERRRHRPWEAAAFLVLCVVGQFLVANGVKALVHRARPDVLHLTGFSGTSFPSGHAAASAASFAAFALVLGRGRTRRVRGWLAGSAVGTAVAVAATRVLLGVHWLTDVLAGLAIGWAWFALCSMAFGGRLLRFGEPVEVAEAVASR